MQIKQHYQLPAPGGRYRVGISASQYSYVLGDGTVREIPCTIFYPSEDSAALKAHPYGGSPDCASHIKTNTYEGLPVAAGCFPLIVFSHGMGLCVETHTILLEALASHGYVICPASTTKPRPLTRKARAATMQRPKPFMRCRTMGSGPHQTPISRMSPCTSSDTAVLLRQLPKR